MMISPAQIRAARGLLSWSQDMLAIESGVGINTINKYEKGEEITYSRLSKIRQSLEDKDIEFFGENGVSRRTDSHRIYKGADSCDSFYEEMLSAAKTKGGEIVAIYRTAEALAQSLGAANNASLERLEQLSKYAKVKCLLSDAAHSTLVIPSFEFRAVPQHPPGFWSSMTCGNKHAIVATKDGVDFVFFVMTSFDFAQADRTAFWPRWDSAVPVVFPEAHKKLRAKK